MLLIGKLSSGDRQKIMTICTIEVHNRDVIAKLILQKVENSQAFTWLSQLRHRWDDREADCFANICDAQFRYSHEYLGNTPRLVITPLTDRSAYLVLSVFVEFFTLLTSCNSTNTVNFTCNCILLSYVTCMKCRRMRPMFP